MPLIIGPRNFDVHQTVDSGRAVGPMNSRQTYKQFKHTVVGVVRKTELKDLGVLFDANSNFVDPLKEKLESKRSSRWPSFSLFSSNNLSSLSKAERSTLLQEINKYKSRPTHTNNQIQTRPTVSSGVERFDDLLRQLSRKDHVGHQLIEKDEWLVDAVRGFLPPAIQSRLVVTQDVNSSSYDNFIDRYGQTHFRYTNEDEATCRKIEDLQSNSAIKFNEDAGFSYMWLLFCCLLETDQRKIDALHDKLQYLPIIDDNTEKSLILSYFFYYICFQFKAKLMTINGVGEGDVALRFDQGRNSGALPRRRRLPPKPTAGDGVTGVSVVNSGSSGSSSRKLDPRRRLQGSVTAKKGGFEIVHPGDAVDLSKKQSNRRQGPKKTLPRLPVSAQYGAGPVSTDLDTVVPTKVTIASAQRSDKPKGGSRTPPRSKQRINPRAVPGCPTEPLWSQLFTNEDSLRGHVVSQNNSIKEEREKQEPASKEFKPWDNSFTDPWKPLNSNQKKPSGKKRSLPNIRTKSHVGSNLSNNSPSEVKKPRKMPSTKQQRNKWNYSTKTGSNLYLSAGPYRPPEPRITKRKDVNHPEVTKVSNPRSPRKSPRKVSRVPDHKPWEPLENLPNKPYENNKSLHGGSGSEKAPLKRPRWNPTTNTKPIRQLLQEPQELRVKKKPVTPSTWV